MLGNSGTSSIRIDESVCVPFDIKLAKVLLELTSATLLLVIIDDNYSGFDIVGRIGVISFSISFEGDSMFSTSWSLKSVES